MQQVKQPVRLGVTIAMYGIAMCGIVALGACGKKDTGAADTTMSMMTHTDSALNTGTMTTATATAMTDAQIFAKLDAANQGEIDAGKMASSKGTNADVKAFGRMMVTDHGKLKSDGDALAKRLNVTPDTMAADSIRSANRMLAARLDSTAKGMTFDSAYVNAQVMGHQATLDMLKTAADQAQNADLKTALNNAIPVVQRHLDRIKDIQSKMSQ